MQRGLRMVASPDAGARPLSAPHRARRETARGTSGSVIYDLTVPELKGGLSLSAVVVSSRQASRVPSAQRDETDLSRRWAAGRRRPAVRSRADDVLSAYAEVDRRRRDRRAATSS